METFKVQLPTSFATKKGICKFFSGYNSLATKLGIYFFVNLSPEKLCQSALQMQVIIFKALQVCIFGTCLSKDNAGGKLNVLQQNNIRCSPIISLNKLHLSLEILDCQLAIIQTLILSYDLRVDRRQAILLVSRDTFDLARLTKISTKTKI